MIQTSVSILVLAYNHGAFLRQALDSILVQREVTFEVILGEDASDDDTLEICQSYQQQYPDLIRIVHTGENVGMHANLARIWKQAQGKYIALCEGDDYWLSPTKLSHQVEWMERHPGYTMCGHWTNRVQRDGNGDWVYDGCIKPLDIKKSYGVEDLIPSYSFHTSSVMIHRDVVHFPEWFTRVYCADRPLYLLCAEQGPVGCIPEVMSCYRLHDTGAWSPTSLIDKADQGIDLFGYIDAHFSGRYHALIQRTLHNIIWSYMDIALRSGDIETARRLYWQAIYQQPLHGNLRHRLVAAVRLYLPRLYRSLKGESASQAAA